LTDAGSLTLTNDTVTAGLAVASQGLLIAHGSDAINGSFSNAASGTLRIEDTSASTATAKFATGFSNAGEIDLTTQSVGGASATLTVTSGTLTNTGTIKALAGTVGGARTINATLVNQGTFEVDQNLALNGSLDSSAGTVTVAANQTLTLQNGTTTLGSGTTLSGSGTIGFGISEILAIAASNFTLQATAPTLVFNNGNTISGAGTLTDAGSLTLTNDTVTAGLAVASQGLLIAHGSDAINGSFSNAVGGTLRLEGSVSGTGTAAFASGFSNAGEIEIGRASCRERV
jgi:hypothetical protein